MTNVVEKFALYKERLFVRVSFVDVVLQSKVQRIITAAVDAAFQKWQKVNSVGLCRVQNSC